MNKHLSTLSILHYIYGAFICLSGLAALFLVMLGASMDVLFGSLSGGEPMPTWLGGALQTIGVILFVVIETWGVFSLLAGHWITQRKHRTGTMILAGFHCLSIPFGLMLGIFTFIVLSDEEVQRAYSSGASANFQFPTAT